MLTIRDTKGLVVRVHGDIPVEITEKEIIIGVPPPPKIYIPAAGNIQAQAHLGQEYYNINQADPAMYESVGSSYKYNK